MAARIGPASTDIRLPTAGLPRELAPLIAAVNQALDRLEQGFRAQRDFTADAAHELRTPLTVLKTHVDLMGDKQVAAMLRQDIDTMGRLVEQMLDIAEADSLVVAAGERADLRAVCADVAAYLAPLALRRDREIAVTGASDPVWVRGNNEALFHAVANLADNALRHTPKDTTVELEVGADGVVRVLDEGPGVPETERSLVFRRFWRRDRRGNASTGLGLAIVSRIAEAHGGRVAVDDRPPRGAAFVLDLSAARLSAAA
jgi:signal transduction histidine kinase